MSLLLALLSGGVNGTATITGVQATFSAGTLTATGDANVSVTGVQATFAAGTVTASGSATANITGAQAAFAAGTVSATGAANATIAGMGATFSAGVLSASAQSGLDDDAGSGKYKERTPSLLSGEELLAAYGGQASAVPAITHGVVTQTTAISSSKTIDGQLSNVVSLSELTAADLKKRRQMLDEDELILLLLAA